MGQLTAVAVITVLAVISPGADFAMTVRNSYLYGRTAGVLAAVGTVLVGLGTVLALTPSTA